jgi:hypothetical protein
MLVLSRKVSQKMSIQFYAISIQPARVVATEVDPAEAAVLLDAAHSVLLAAPTDLVRVALHYNKPLTIFSREDVLRRCRIPSSAITRRPQPSLL